MHMSSTYFDVVEHISPSQYIRQHPWGAKSDDAKLRLAVKEYRTRDSTTNDDEDAVTIIASHGNGFPKETYEPLFDDLVKNVSGFRIRAIWIADVANQAASYALNKDELGDDPNWFDHSRDLLLMVNHFREQMKPPFFGLAHSMGCAHIVNLALIHPRLFHSIILLEPVIQDHAPPGPNAAMMTSLRRGDKWPSRAVAEKQISKSPFFAAFDPRVMKNYLKYTLSDQGDGSVTLATPKAQEAWSYVRATFEPLPEEPTTVEDRQRERLLNPELVPGTKASKMVFTRPEGVPLLEMLLHVRPRVLYVYGSRSHINFDKMRDLHLSRTGTGASGNGGVADGGVESVIINKCSHLVCFENTTGVAKSAGAWMQKEMTRWRKEKEFFARYDRGTSKNGRTELSDKWLAGVKQDANIQRSAKTAKL